MATCTTCGGEIVETTVLDSICYTDGPGPLAGSGDTKPRQVSYCPKCDPKPRGTIIHMSIADALGYSLW